MNKEHVLLTGETPNTYPRRGVIFMPEVDSTKEAIVEAAVAQAQETPADEVPQIKKEQRKTPEQEAKEWVGRVHARLSDIARQKGIETTMQETDEVSGLLEHMDSSERLSLLRELANIERQHKELFEKTPELRRLGSQLKEAVAQFDDVGPEQNLASAPQDFIEGIYSQFGRYMQGESIKISYDKGATDVDVRQTSDGATIIHVPENPNLQTLIQIAQQLHPESFSSETTDNLRQFAQDLQIAALVMDSYVFSPASITELYNFGAKLAQMVEHPQEEFAPVSYKDITQEAQTNPVSTEDKDRIFLDVLLGRHQISSAPKEPNGYDKLFARWQQKNQTPGQSLSEQQEAFDHYLLGRSDRMIRLFRPHIEEALKETGVAQQKTAGVVEKAVSENVLRGMVKKWQEVVEKTEGGKAIAQKAQEVKGQGNLESQLAAITQLFQPGTNVDILQYVPAEIKQMLLTGTSFDRTAAACVIATAYEMHVLQNVLGEQYAIVPELVGNHATLLVVDRDSGDIFRVDPNAPQDKGMAVSKLSTEESALIKALRHQLDRGQDVNLQMKVGDKVHTLMSGDKLLTSELLGNLAADETFLQTDNAGRFALAQKAVDIAPENPVAWVTMAKYATDGRGQDYQEYAQSLDSSMESLAQSGEIRVGNWIVPPGVAGVAPDIQQVIDRVDAQLGGQPINQLDSLSLDNAWNELATLYSTYFAAPIPNLAQANNIRLLMSQLNEVRVAAGADAPPQVFNLSRGDIDLFSGTETLRMREALEKRRLDFGRKGNAGNNLPGNETEILQAQLRDINTVLTANKNVGADDVRELAASLSEAILYPTKMAADLESGDAQRQQQGAKQTAEGMDNEGGNRAFKTLLGMSEGRVHMLVESFSTVMEQRRRELGGVIPGNEYRKIESRVVEEQIRIALAGVGRYARYPSAEIIRIQTSGTAQERADLAKAEAEIKDLIKIDSFYAHEAFIITGQASTIGIRGFDRDANTFDPTSTPYMDAILKDFQRYYVLGDKAKKGLDRLLRARALWQMRIHYSEETYNDMIKNPKRLQQYIERVGFDLIAPPSDKFWENQFIRIRPMISVVNQWTTDRHADIPFMSGREYDYARETYKVGKDEHTRWRTAGDRQVFFLGGRILAAEPIVTPGESKGAGKVPDDPIVQDIMEEYQVRVLPDKETNKPDIRRQDIRFGLMHKYLAQWHPEKIMEAFAYETDPNTAREGYKGDLDKRFTEFFTSPESNFLEAIGRREGMIFDISGQPLQGDAMAQRRFEAFQRFIVPALNSIRSDAINGVELVFNPATGQLERVMGRKAPVQVDFGAAAFPELDGLAPGAAANVQRMMRAMTDAVKASGRGDPFRTGQPNRNSLIARLAYDPMMEHVLRKAPIELIDVPYWMMHGKDVFGKEKSIDINQMLGGNNQFARFYGDNVHSSKARAGIMKTASGNPNEIEKVLQTFQEETAESIKMYKGNADAWDSEAPIEASLLDYVFAKGGEIIGAEDSGLFARAAMFLGKGPEARKTFGFRTRALNSAQLKTLYWTTMFPRLGFAEKTPQQRFMYDMIFGRGRKRRARGVWKILFVALMLTIQSTLDISGSAFNEQLKAA
ncbi:MAG TPA: hypothetical protein VFQ63_00550 [Patescibacteria group bacterium]|nr:hypothetical protein [Patescibacteria group bacterium]